jgi:antitoxin component of MazEF toxin-antitoxin module
MKTNIIRIGNSQGVRIPKILLEQSRLGTEVDLSRDFGIRHSKGLERRFVVNPSPLPLSRRERGSRHQSSN